MASPLASSSRHILGNVPWRQSRSSALRLVRRQPFSTTSLRRNDEQRSTATQTLSEEAVTANERQDDASAGFTLRESGLKTRNKTGKKEAEGSSHRQKQPGFFKKSEYESARRETRMRDVRLDAMAGAGSAKSRENAYKPHQEKLTPLSARELSVSHLLAATAHVGHAKSALMRASAQFVYGTRHGQTIIDVEKYTLPALRLACKVVKDTVYRDGVVVFVGTAEGTEEAVVAAAKRLGKNGFHVSGSRWLPGTLSNASRVLTPAVLSNAEEYEEMISAKQRTNDARQENRALRDLSAFDPARIASQELQPNLMIVMNPKRNLYAIQEATQIGVPTIGIIDTDVDPRMVTYAIPANDESIRTAELILGLLSRAGQEGLQARQQWEQERGRVRSVRRLSQKPSESISAQQIESGVPQ